MGFIALDGEWLTRGFAAGTTSADQVLRESGDEEGWLPARVPGEIHLDLMRNGVIPDPFYRDNEESTRWVHDQDWWFRKSFPVDPQILDDDCVELVCEGLDTFAMIFLNGQPVGGTENMFRCYRFDARPFLRGGDNEIVIGFHAPEVACRELAAEHGHLPGGFNFPDIVQARKAQYACGWDWGPFLAATGIWKPIRIEHWSTARISDVYARAVEITPERATIEVQVEITAVRAHPVTVSVGIAPEVGDVEMSASQEAHLVAGVNHATLRLDIPDPRLWWPAGFGEQSRYRVEVQVAGTLVTAYAEVPLGLRSVALLRAPDAEGESFVIAVNGTPIFCKGANWIPGDQFLPRVDEAYYRRHLELARDAGCNMLRVWGGGIYETETFYSLCDQLGLLVWQDFLFACGAYPEYDIFKQNVIEEATQAIRQLRNHPSLVLWCGNNEDHWLFPKEKGFGGYAYYDDILPRLCAELDPSRPYWNGSPYSPHGEANSMTSGDRHAWEVWGGLAADEQYLLDTGRFLSEFGCQAPPTMPTIERFTEPEDRYPWSRVMEIHQKMPEKHVRLYRYLARHLPVPAALPWWVYAAQVTQCLVLRRGIAHWRARKWQTSGTLFWQLNDCWPVTSWSIVDYYGRPKPAWYEVRRLYRPQLVTIEPVVSPAAFHGGIIPEEEWARLPLAVRLVNDALNPVDGNVRIRLMDTAGIVSWEDQCAVTVAANSVTTVRTIEVGEMGAIDLYRQYLVAEWVDDKGKELSRDIYLFAEPKHLALSADALSFRQTGERTVTVSARDLALYIEIDAGEGEPLDNFFHLLPGETREIHITGPLHSLHYRSINDLLREAKGK